MDLTQTRAQGEARHSLGKANLSTTSDTEMDVDGAKKDAKADPNSFNSYKKAKKEKHDKIDAKKRRKTTNTMTFKNKVTKNKKGGRK